MSSPAPTLDYSTRSNLYRRTHYWLNVARFCAATPMVVGTIVVLIWLVTFDTHLEWYGIATILGGLALFVIGACSLLAYTVITIANPATRRPSWKKSAVIAVLLLVANFPLCALYIRIAQEWSITVENQSGVPFESFDFIKRDGSVTAVGPIAAGKCEHVWLSPKNGGPLIYKAHTPAGDIEGQADVYLDADSFGERTTVTITAPPPMRSLPAAIQP